MERESQNIGVSDAEVVRRRRAYLEGFWDGMSGGGPTSRFGEDSFYTLGVLAGFDARRRLRMVRCSTSPLHLVMN